MVLWRGQETWNNQLPYIETRTWRSLWWSHLWTYKRLGMCVWEIQTDPLQRDRLWPLWGWSNTCQGSSWTYGTHRVESACITHLVLQRHPFSYGIDLGYEPTCPWRSYLLRSLCGDRSKRYTTWAQIHHDRTWIPWTLAWIRTRFFCS